MDPSLVCVCVSGEEALGVCGEGGQSLCGVEGGPRAEGEGREDSETRRQTTCGKRSEGPTSGARCQVRSSDEADAKRAGDGERRTREKETCARERSKY